MFKIYKWTFATLVFAGILTIENKCMQSMHIPFTNSIDGKLSVYLTIIKNNTTPLILERVDKWREKSEIIQVGQITINKQIGFIRNELNYSAEYTVKRKADGAFLYFLDIVYIDNDSILYVILNAGGFATQETSILVPFMALDKHGRADIILTLGPSISSSAVGIRIQETP
jgi:hypothetical protein